MRPLVNLAKQTLNLRLFYACHSKKLYFSLIVWIKMKYLSILFGCLVLTSCNYFKTKKTSTEAILKEELQSFNWSEVDEYPSLAVCDSLTDKHDQKRCFETAITRHVLQRLSEKQLTVRNDLNDTVFIDFKLSEKGEISILKIQANQNVRDEIPELDQFIHASIEALPQIFPAIKRGQQVTTQFRLPIIIRSN